MNLKRGFVFDNPFEYMPGEKINSYEDLEKYVVNVAEDNDVFAAERERVNMIINSYNDGESCQRVEKSFMLMRYKCLKSKRQ